MLPAACEAMGISSCQTLLPQISGAHISAVRSPCPQPWLHSPALLWLLFAAELEVPGIPVCCIFSTPCLNL